MKIKRTHQLYNKKIAVSGLGYVGLPLARLLASKCGVRYVKYTVQS